MAGGSRISIWQTLETLVRSVLPLLCVIMGRFVRETKEEAPVVKAGDAPPEEFVLLGGLRRDEFIQTTLMTQQHLPKSE